MNGNSGRDRLYGNGGNDKLVSRDRKIGEPLNGGSGRDRATADRGDRLVSVERAVRRAVAPASNRESLSQPERP